MIKKISVFLLSFLTLPAMSEETVRPVQGALQNCENEFGKTDNEADCKHGVHEGMEEIYQELTQAGMPPSFHDFRTGYLYAKQSCLELVGAEKQMACVDGLDTYTGLLAASANYKTQDAANQALKFTNDYYNSHQWSHLYEELTDDQWMFVIQQRVVHPENYPGTRLSQYYVPAPKAQTYQPGQQPEDERRYLPPVIVGGAAAVVVVPFFTGMHTGAVWGHSVVFPVIRGGFGSSMHHSHGG